MPKSGKTSNANGKIRRGGYRRGNSVFSGRFVPCPASFVAHPGWHFCEVLISDNGAYHFVCTCTTRVFLNQWSDAWGFTLRQVEVEWGVPIDIPPARREELEAEEQGRIRHQVRQRLEQEGLLPPTEGVVA